MLNIGKNGRLGNQMFQYAILYKLSKLYNKEIHLPIYKTGNKYFNFELDIFENVTFTSIDIYTNSYSESTLKNILGKDLITFNENVVDVYNFVKNNPSKIINLNGYFQSSDYFDDIRSNILHLYKFNDTIIQKCNSFLKKFTTTVSIHIRRGDYIGGSYTIYTPSFIEKCKQYIRESISLKRDNPITFIVFSDDMKWCRENLKNVEYSPFTNQAEDMCCMSLCNHNIISPSTFSWWAAYLNQHEDKVVICSNPWFTNPSINVSGLMHNVTTLNI